MKKILIISSLLFLSSCAGHNQERPPVIKTQYELLTLEDKYYECNKTVLPNIDFITNYDISKLINDLYKDVSICYENMKAQKEFKEKGKKIVEERNKKNLQ